MNSLSFDIFTLEIGGDNNLLYIVKDKATNETIVIDPAWDCKRIINLLKENHCNLTSIVLTHTHNDHINALDDLLIYRSVPIHISTREKDFWGRDDLNFIEYQNDEELIQLGETQFKVYHLPGHSIGSMAIYSQGHLFLGDTLFVYGCGHCRSTGANPKELFHSLQKIKKLFTDEVIIYPGHDYGITKTSTIGEQKLGNPFLLINNEEDFVEYRMVKHNRSIPFGPETSI